jgi:hypothetical protein
VLCGAKVSGGIYDRVIDEAHSTADRWGRKAICRTRPLQPVQKVQEWKAGLRRAADKEETRLRALDLVQKPVGHRRQEADDGRRQSTQVYLEGLVWTTKPTQTPAQLPIWTELVPNRRHRVGLLRKKTGIIKGLLSHCDKGIKGFRRLPLHDRRSSMRCPCGDRTQDAAHVMLECRRLQGTRDEIKRQVLSQLGQHGEHASSQVVTGFSATELNSRLLGGNRVFPSVQAEKISRQVAAAVWDNEGAAELRDLMQENEARRQAIRQRLETAGPAGQRAGGGAAAD